jgi:hypothetical protein
VNSKFWFGIFILVVAAIISGVAAYFSIVGLVALFAARGLAVAIMGGSLELGKLAASSWLKLNWSNPRVNFLHRFYMLFAVVMLMIITSIGIYGFLAAGHLEQNAPSAGIAVQSSQIETRLAQVQGQNKRLEQRLNQIDQNVAVFLQAGSGSRGLRASGTLKAERDQLQKTLDANNQQINTLNDKLVPLKMQSSEVEAKLGPIKYFGAAVGLTDTEAAVRLVIIILISAFDTLAVIMMLSGIITLKEWKEERNAEPVYAELDDDLNDGPDYEQDDEPVEVKAAPYDLDLVDGEWKEVPRSEFVRKNDDVAAWEDFFSVPKKDEEIAETETFDVGMEPVQEYPEEPVELVQEPELVEETIEPTPEEVIAEEDIETQEALVEAVENIIDELPAEEVVAPEMDREDVLRFLERNPGLVSELAQIVEEQHEEELTDREKLLDLLEKNPTIINDMAEIIAQQMRPTSDRWLG